MLNANTDLSSDAEHIIGEDEGNNTNSYEANFDNLNSLKTKKFKYMKMTLNMIY